MQSGCSMRPCFPRIRNSLRIDCGNRRRDFWCGWHRRKC
jgi:hypothetical protein